MQVSRHEHLYLEDHQLAGQPVLPLAAALDLVAHAAVEATGRQGAPILVRDFRLKQPVRIADSAHFTISVSGEKELTVALSSGAQRSSSRPPAYTAFATPGAEVGTALASALPAPPAASIAQPPMSLEEFYSGYTFHGPRMRAILGIEQIGPQGIVGTVRTSTPKD